MILESKLGRLKGWHLIVIMAMTMSGCMTTNVLGKGPVLTMDSGILVNQRKFRVPFLDGADIMVFSPDNRYLVTTGSYSQHINVYDVESRKIVKRFPKEDKNKNWKVSQISAAFTSDSRYLVLRNINKNIEGKFHIIDTNTFEVVNTVITDIAGGEMYFSRDGMYLAFEGGVSLTNNPRKYGKHPIISLYDAKTWELLNGEVTKGFGPSSRVEFTPDGQYLVDVAKLGDDYEATKDNPPVIRIWSLPDLKIVRTIDGFYVPKATIGDIKLSHDGKMLATLAQNKETVSGLGGTLLIDLDTGKLINDYDGPSGYLGFSKNMKYLFAGRGGSAKYFIYVLDVEKFDVLEKVTLDPTNAEVVTAFSPDGTKIALSQGRVFYVWDVKE